MKKILYIQFFILLIISCKAQTISLEQAAACRENPSTCPSFNYVKDMNNTLNMYVGTWRGTYNGKNYEFNFIKKISVGTLTKWDKLIGRLKVTDNNGNIIYNSFDKPDDNTFLFGLNFVNGNFKTYSLGFIVNTKCNDSGRLYLISKPTLPTNQLSLNFWREPDLVDVNKCPNIDNYITLIPKDISIILTKQ